MLPVPLSSQCTARYAAYTEADKLARTQGSPLVV
jgi:hypothetical protein